LRPNTLAAQASQSSRPWLSWTGRSATVASERDRFDRWPSQFDPFRTVGPTRSGHSNDRGHRVAVLGRRGGASDPRSFALCCVPASV